MEWEQRREMQHAWLAPAQADDDSDDWVVLTDSESETDTASVSTRWSEQCDW